MLKEILLFHMKGLFLSKTLWVIIKIILPSTINGHLRTFSLGFSENFFILSLLMDIYIIICQGIFTQLSEFSREFFSSQVVANENNFFTTISQKKFPLHY